MVADPARVQAPGQVQAPVLAPRLPRVRLQVLVLDPDLELAQKQVHMLDLMLDQELGQVLDLELGDEDPDVGKDVVRDLAGAVDLEMDRVMVKDMVKVMEEEVDQATKKIAMQKLIFLFLKIIMRIIITCIFLNRNKQ